MKVVEVKSRRQLSLFISFPDKLYRDCEYYVPALHSDQRNTLLKNPALEYCSRKMFLAYDDKGKVAGRICAMINPRYNALYGKKCCRFGWFDTVQDLQIARALIDAASAWARENGMNQIHGPLFFNTLGKQGMLVDGFARIPQFNTIYNYSYYNDFMQALGFEKECDWVQCVNHDFNLPDKLLRISDRIKDRYGLHFGSIDALKKDPRRVMDFLRMYSDCFSRSVYNFIPFTEAEMRQEARESLSMVSDRHCVLLMDKDDNVAAFGISFPSISRALQKARGHIFPFGWIHILRALRGHNETVDLMLTGVAPGWTSKGLSALLHAESSKKFKALGARLAITNPQIETNNAVNVWSEYPSSPFMRRRCYIKNLD